MSRCPHRHAHDCWLGTHRSLLEAHLVSENQNSHQRTPPGRDRRAHAIASPIRAEIARSIGQWGLRACWLGGS